jgi:two-component system LytT family response regulator
MVMKALIVDDEFHAREELEALLNETGEFRVMGKCANALEAIQAIRREKPDVLFLDIQMPAINGFELLSMIDESHMPIVVFVTAYDEYALKAFEESPLDYLLKPVEKARLAKTIQKIRRLQKNGEHPVYAGQAIRKIPCLLSSKVKLVNVDDVEYVRSGEAGIYVVTASAEYYTELSLATLESRTGLVRCHRQFLVNLDLVDEILLQENLLAEIKMKSGKRVPVSRRHLKKLKETLQF